METLTSQVAKIFIERELNKLLTLYPDLANPEFFNHEIRFVGKVKTNRAPLTAENILHDFAKAAGKENDKNFPNLPIYSSSGVNGCLLLDLIHKYEERSKRQLLPKDSDNLWWLEDYQITYHDLAIFFAYGSAKVEWAQVDEAKKRRNAELKREMLSSFLLRKAFENAQDEIPVAAEEKKEAMHALSGCMTNSLPSKAINFVERLFNKPAPQQVTISGFINFFAPAYY